MESLEEINDLLLKLHRIGEKNIKKDDLQIVNVNIFKKILNKDGTIDKQKYLHKDHFNLEYNELLIRYILINAILDQGPDMEGVRILLCKTTNDLYDNGIYFLHEPSQFFKNIDFVFQTVQKNHQDVKKQRSKKWAKIQNSTPNRYNLFLDNSKQISSYVIGRWGPPLSIIQILINKKKKLLDLFKEQESAELLSEFIKSDEKWGMGKAIGNKASHLLIKWIIFRYELIVTNEPKWSQNSYELPFDSNAGRVLFMSGFFHYFLPSLNTEKGRKKILEYQKKEDKYFMYITNAFRGRYIEIDLDKKIENDIKIFLKKYFGVRPRKIQVQHIINYFSSINNCKIGSIDDGLMCIGTKYCINRGNQHCKKCKINNECSGKNDNERKTRFYT